MKTGDTKQRLSERLALEMEKLVAGHLASMDAQVKSLSSDIEAIATDARNTIRRDTATFLSEIQGSFERQRAQMRRAERRLPMTIAAAFGLAIILMLATSLAMIELNAHLGLNALGITRIREPGETLLVLDPARSQVTTCTISGRALPCIRVGKD